MFRGGKHSRCQWKEVSNVIASTKQKKGIIPRRYSWLEQLGKWVRWRTRVWDPIRYLLLIDCCSYLGSFNRTSTKNFLAPTLRAFFSAATKSLLMLMRWASWWMSNGWTYILLSNISHECIDFISLFDQPGKDARCICFFFNVMNTRCMGRS